MSVQPMMTNGGAHSVVILRGASPAEADVLALESDHLVSLEPERILDALRHHQERRDARLLARVRESVAGVAGLRNVDLHFTVRRGVVNCEAQIDPELEDTLLGVLRAIPDAARINVRIIDTSF